MNKNTGCYFFLVLILNIIITKNIQAGWNEFWYRKIITNNFSCSGDLTNFPLLVVISNDASLSAKASNNGHDIAFTGYDGTTRLAHEIEYYDAGTLVAWVRIPLFSAAVQSSNIIYMYYCKDGSGNQQDTQAVWSEKYLTVQHFEETSGTLISDSSSNGYNGTAAGVKTLNTNTVIGSGAALNNGSDGFSLATGVFNPSAGTWSIWYYTDYTAEGTAVRIFNANHSSGSDWEHRDYKSGGNMTRRFYYGNDAYISTSFSLSGWDNKWNQICYTWEYSGGTTTVNVFTNGILTSTYSSANLLINADLNWELGHWQSVSPACVMDEFNTASAARSAGWIKTAYSNQVNPAAFRSIGAEETNPHVIITECVPSAYTTAAGEELSFSVSGRLLIGTFTSLAVDFGDGITDSKALSGVLLNSEKITHTYARQTNCIAAIIVYASTGEAVTNGISISVLPYRMFGAGNLQSINAARGILLNWSMQTCHNLLYCNIYKNNKFLKKITENLDACRYLDELIVYGKTYSYAVENIYSIGSIMSATNISLPYNQYKIEYTIGSGGGTIANLLAELVIRENTFSDERIFGISIISNDYLSISSDEFPVYNQIVLESSNPHGGYKKEMTLTFKIPVTNGALALKQKNSAPSPDYAKDRLILVRWDGKSAWEKIHTVSATEEHTDDFLFYKLTAGVNTEGIFGVTQNTNTQIFETVQVKNRVFAPLSGIRHLSAVYVTFPNNHKKNVEVRICAMDGKEIYRKYFNSWISLFSWDGKKNNDQYAAIGFYMISIIVDGNQTEAFRVPVYFLK